ncbi:sodium-dependent transporter [candidate division KSB1 bacterium]|nr:sodium-dependent transporter [candidate division KSB1 bacterium]
MSTHRGEFNSKLGFILATAGSAVGLGNIWGFPFQVGSGGGAIFVLIYLAFCFILCYPIMVTEVAIGRKTSRNPVGAFNALGFRKWSFIGKLGIVSGFLILSFYNVLAAWSLGYFIEMLQGNFEVGQKFTQFTSNVPLIAVYSVIFMSATAFIVSGGIKSGIERTAKLLMPSLVIIILFLVGYAFTLPNAMQGIEFYLMPDFSKLNLQVVYSALGQAFFSLSLGMGALITYGSYFSRKEDIISSVAYITLADVGIAFAAGLMMFPFVFSQGLAPNGGSGLIFVTLPGVFASLGPMLGVFIGALFFLLLSFAALTSTVSLLEVPVAYVIDEYKLERKKAAWLVAGAIFLVSIPSILANGASEFFTSFVHYFGHDNPKSFMAMVVDVANSSLLPLGGCLISFFTAYIWKKENLNQELRIGNETFEGSFIEKYIGVAVCYLCPFILGVLFILTVLDLYFGIKIIT